MDYEKEEKYLPASMRDFIGSASRVTSTVETSYLRLFQGDEAMAVRNNYRAYEVSSGYLKEFNNSNLMSGIAPRLSNILVSKICGKVAIEGPDVDETLDDKAKTAARAVNKHGVRLFKQSFSEAKLTKLLKIAYSDAVDTGRGTIFLNAKNGKVQTRVFNCFRCKIKYDIFGKIIDAKAFISLNNSKPFEDWILTEWRYYRDNIPYQKYILVRSTWGDQNKKDEVKYFEKKETVPSEKLDEYRNLEVQLYKEEKLEGFLSLGVYPIDNTINNKKYKYVQIPESQFVNVQDLIIERDVTETQKATEQNLGRARVLIPTFMNSALPMLGGNGSKIVKGAGIQVLDKTIFNQYESKSMDDCKPSNVQFDFRAAEWRTSVEGLVGDICAAFGITVLDYDPRILQTGQHSTDDEINAMTDITSNMVCDKREMNEEVINQMLNQIAVCLGVKTPVFIRWSMASIMNPTKNQALITQQLANGTISRREAIKRSNPDYTDEEVDEEYNRIMEERSASMPSVFDEEETEE